jgi:hypothetical protein
MTEPVIPGAPRPPRPQRPPLRPPAPSSVNARLGAVANALEAMAPPPARDGTTSTLEMLAQDLKAGGPSLAGTSLVMTVPPALLLPDATVRSDSWVRRVEVLRDLLVFVPVLVTWWQLRYALEAYNRSVVAAQRDHTTAVSFLLGWQRGFNGQTWPLSRSALIVVLIITLVIASTLVCSFWRGRIEAANSRSSDRSKLADLLMEGTLLLTKASRSGTSEFTRADIESMVRGFYENSDRLTNALQDTGKQINDSLQSGPGSRLEKAIREWSESASALRDLGRSLTVPSELLAKLQELERALAASSLRLTTEVASLVSQLGEQTEAAGHEAAAHIQMARDVSDATTQVGRAFDTFTARLEQLGSLVDELRLLVDRTRMTGNEDWVD